MGLGAILLLGGLVIVAGLLLWAFQRQRLGMIPAEPATPAGYVLPIFIYYFMGLFVVGFLAGQTGALFFPGLWFSPAYWANWLVKILEVIGFIPLLLSIQAIIMMRPGRPAAVIRCLWGAYLVFGLLVSYPIYTHNYYSLPLIPLAGLTIAGLADQLLARLPRRSSQLRLFLPVAAVIVIIGVGLAQYLPTTIVTEQQIREVVTAKEIGSQLNHSTKVIFLAYDYGSCLKYYGELAGYTWPTYGSRNFLSLKTGAPFKLEAYFQQLMAETPYDYFVITSRLEQALQPDLLEYLEMHFPVVSQTADYLIYDLRA